MLHGKSLQLCPTLFNPMNCSPPGSSVHGDSPGNNTGDSCHAFLQGIFPTQGLNPGLPHCSLSFPGSSEGKASPCNTGDLDSIPGSGRSPGEGNGNSLQYSCLENPMDGGAWWAAVHRVAESWTQLVTSLSLFTFMHWRRNGNPLQYCCLENPHGQRSLVGYRP